MFSCGLELGQRAECMYIRTVCHTSSHVSSGNPAITEPYLAQFRMNGPGNNVHERGFAGAVLSENRVNFAGIELDAHIAERRDS